jgi:GrpB-like predicted nucleotidyltransferase (UPF0157 family)
MSPVVLVPYDPEWPGMFEGERVAILSELRGLDAVVEHIGSTSVPGLLAKPKIDVLLGLPTWDEVERAVDHLKRLGYEDEPQLPKPRHLSVKRGHPTHHRVHLVERGGVLWAEYLSFRDTLRAHPGFAIAYAALKQELAVLHSDDHRAYSTGKDAFVQGVLQASMAASASRTSAGQASEFDQGGATTVTIHDVAAFATVLDDSVEVLLVRRRDLDVWEVPGGAGRG